MDFNRSILKSRNIISDNEDVDSFFKEVTLLLSNIETRWPNPMCTFDELFKAVKDQKIVIGTQILTNIRKTSAPLGACTVIPINLSKEFSVVKSEITPFLFDGFGMGFDLNDLEDPVSVFKQLNTLFCEVNPYCRRAVAGLALLNVNNHAILDFICVKRDTDFAQWKFITVVNVDDAFLQSLAENKQIELFKCGNATDTRLGAREIENALIDSIYLKAEPGLVFMQRFEVDNPTPQVKYEALAPCAEVALAPGEVCHFSYLNIANFVERGIVDYPKLIFHTRMITRMLDNSLEITIAALNDESKQIVQSKRQIGIGICGLASLLYKLRIAYGSKESFDIINNVMSIINYYSKLESVMLSRERGAFPLFNYSRYNEDKWFLHNKTSSDYIADSMWKELFEQIQISGIRNCSTTALPPTGNSSRIVYASNGVEPMLSLINENGEIDADFIAALKNEMLDLGTIDAIINQVRIYKSCSSIKEIPLPLREIFVTASDVSSYKQLRVVEIVQKNVDQAVSKTVNLPKGTSKKELREILKYAYEHSLKGISIYIDD